MIINKITYNDINSKKNGLWLVIENNLVFWDKKDGFLDYPVNKSSAEKYAILNCGNKKAVSITSKTVKYDSFDTAFNKLLTKMLSKGVKYEIYLIVGIYRTDKQQYGRNYLTTKSICALIKDENNNIYVKNVNYREEPFLENCHDKELLQSIKKYKMSDLLLPVIKNEESYLEKQIKENFNIGEIIFRSKCNLEKKEEILKELQLYLTQLNKVINMKLMPTINIAFENIRGANADYIKNYSQIRLRLDSISSFYHEYFHHIELCRPIKPLLRQNVSSKLKNDFSLELLKRKFLKDKELAEYRENKAYINSKIDKYLTYYLSTEEINARFFSDYIFLKHTFTKNIHNNLSFTVHEIDKYKDEFDSYLRELETIHSKYSFLSKGEIKIE